MPHLIIRTVNSSFDVADQGADYPDVQAAYRAAVKAGVRIAADEVESGRDIAIIEICIEDPEGNRRARGVVSLATSPLDNG